MVREGITVDRKPVTSVRPITDRPADEPSGEPAPWRDDGRAAAANSYKRRVALGAALVGAVAVVGAILYLRFSAPVAPRPLSKVTVSEPLRPVPPAPVLAAPPPKPVQTAEPALRLPDHPHESLAQSARGRSAVAVATPKLHPAAAAPARTALARPVAAAPQGDPDSGYTGFPLQPGEPLPPGMSGWTIPPLYAPAPTTAPKGANTLKPPAHRAVPVPRLAAKPPVPAPPRIALMQPPVVAPKAVAVQPAAPHLAAPPPVAAPKIVAVQLPAPQPVQPHPAAPPPVAAARAKPAPQPPAGIASAAGSDSLPSGTPLHLQIIYTPAGPQEAVRVASLAAKLRTEVDAIATSMSSVAPVKTEVVAYFFPDDRAGATAVAASLARLTKRPEPVKLLHMKPLPRPGTVQILLPLKSGKDLTNESS
jgi:hypothetical protein